MKRNIDNQKKSKFKNKQTNRTTYKEQTIVEITHPISYH